METREYFEKVMQDYNQNRKGRSLRKYCKDEAVDYDWLIFYVKISSYVLTVIYDPCDPCEPFKKIFKKLLGVFERKSYICRQI